jgi:DNA mismatch repair ATPase MutS
LQKVQVELESRSSTLDYVNRNGDELIKKGGEGEEKAQKLQTILNTLNARWTKVGESLNTRINKTASTIKDLGDYQTLVRSLSSWMQEVDAFVTAEVPAIGDLEALLAQLGESEGTLSDLAALSQNFESIHAANAALADGAESAFKQHLVAELDQLTLAWDSINKKCREHVTKVKDLLALNERLVTKMDEMETWLDKINEQYLKEQFVAHTQSELETMVASFEVNCCLVLARVNFWCVTLVIQMSDGCEYELTLCII